MAVTEWNLPRTGRCSENLFVIDSKLPWLPTWKTSTCLQARADATDTKWKWEKVKCKPEMVWRQTVSIISLHYTHFHSCLANTWLMFCRRVIVIYAGNNENLLMTKTIVKRFLVQHHADLCLATASNLPHSPTSRHIDRWRILSSSGSRWREDNMGEIWRPC